MRCDSVAHIVALVGTRNKFLDPCNWFTSTQLSISAYLL
ncbi:hypothetical protein U370_01630 [Anaplasma marginale str. Dawn]|nr:hypothetical protein U370_01630 [Anaplasma marginale str. Dawn]